MSNVYHAWKSLRHAIKNFNDSDNWQWDRLELFCQPHQSIAWWSVWPAGITPQSISLWFSVHTMSQSPGEINRETYKCDNHTLCRHSTAPRGPKRTKDLSWKMAHLLIKNCSVDFRYFLHLLHHIYEVNIVLLALISALHLSPLYNSH